MKISQLLLLIGLIFNACGSDDIVPRCETSGNTIHIAKDWTGTIGYIEEYEVYTINYHIPGTIDSIYTGIICGELDEQFQKIDQQVVFSGLFIDDKETINPLAVFGGQEFYFFDLKNIQFKENSME